MDTRTAIEKYPEHFDQNELKESYSNDSPTDISTGHKFFSKETLINYFPKYKLKKSGKIAGISN
jgi:hypothetical protein